MSDIQKNVSVALGYSMPPVVPVQWDNIIPSTNHKIVQSALTYGSTHWACPTRLALSSKPEDLFTLPLDPVISISSDNSIAKREIAKTTIRGTVKELWTQGDWKISMSGVLATDERGSVNDYLLQLMEIIKSPEALIIENDTLNDIYDVTRVCVESYDFPFTKGLNYQSFSISFISDESYKLDTNI